MMKRKSLKRRWLLNTVGVVLALGLVCVMALTAVYAASCYSGMQSDMEDRAKSAREYFSKHQDLSHDAYYQACVSYVHAFSDRDISELQFITTGGVAAVYSSARDNLKVPATEEIENAINHRDIVPFVGKDKSTGQRVMAVSCPVIYSNGEVIGVLRYVTPTRNMNLRILGVAGLSLAVLILVSAVTLIASNYYLRSILSPLSQITEKAQRIAGGAYGVQIKSKYDDEIGDLAKIINELSDKIAQNEKMQTEFISSLSHELRTPLTAINGWSETLLSDESLDADTKRGVRIISREAKRLTEMVVDLLDFTRMQDGRMTLNVEQTDIRSEFEDTVFMYSSRLAQDGITLDYLENEDDIPEIICDPERLKQVFLNILDNAAKHGGEGKRIEASIHFDGEQVTVRIRDFGPGIPEDEIPLVKRKFYKGSSKARGSGIGLAVCDEIVQMHGGELTLSNAEGGGTLVSVSLPAAQ